MFYSLYPYAEPGPGLAANMLACFCELVGTYLANLIQENID
jgi:hypothetical protein